MRHSLSRAPFSLDAVSLEVQAAQEEHPNKAPFAGCLTMLNEASTRPPGGASGHKVFISAEVAQQALGSLEGMPIDFSQELTDHNKRQVIGFIERGYIDGDKLMVEGYLLPKNWPEAVEEIRRQKHTLGMSYEIASVEVEDTEAPIWNLTHLIFTGAAILKKASAAYQSTSIAAQAEEESMEKTVLDELRTLGAKIDGLQAAHDGDEVAAAQEEEAAAASHDEEASAAITAAQRARADADEEDAAHHETLAAAAHTKAFQARMKASAIHTSLAASQRAAGNEDAATHHEAEATRLAAAAETAQQAAAALTAAQTEAEAAKQVDDDGDVDGMARLMAGMMRAMAGTQEQAAADPLKRKATPWDDDQMARMLAMCMKAMTFQPGVTMSKRAVRAAHDDEPEDKALIRRMLQQHDQGQSAGRNLAASRELLVVRRQLRDLQASNELITDTLKKLTGLLTDQAQGRGLATDGMGQRNNGGQAPQRRSMAGAGGEQWVDKYAGVRNGQSDGKKTERQATEELVAAGITDPRAQMAHILELQQAGLLLVQ